LIQYLRHNPSGTDDYERYDPDSLSGENDDGLDRIAVCSGQKRRDQDHRYNDDILEYQNAKSYASVRAVNFSPSLYQFENDGRAGKRYKKACKDRGANRLAQLPRYNKGNQYRQRYLNRPAQQERFPDLQQSLKRELDSNSKKSSNTTPISAKVSTS